MINMASDCEFCNEPDADFDCNGLKFCNEICGLNYLEPEETIIKIKMKATKSEKIPNGTKGYIIHPSEGLNYAKFENDQIALVYLHEVEVIA
jgi:hypothetical protein